MFDVPAVVISAGGHHGGYRRAGGEHGDHHRVDPAQQLQQFGFRAAQRGAVHRQRPCASAFDRAAQRLNVSGVAGQLLGAVVEHRNGGGVGGHRGPRGFHPGEAGHTARAARTARCRGAHPVQHTPGRGVGRCGEAEASHQQGVAEEGMQLAQVRHTALGQVDMGLQGDARGCGRALHQVGVRCLLATDHNRRDPAGQRGVDGLLQCPVTTQHPDHDHSGPVDQTVQFAGAQPRRVGPPVGRSAGARSDQVGVRGRQQQDGGLGHPLFVPQPRSPLTPRPRRTVVGWPAPVTMTPAPAPCTCTTPPMAHLPGSDCPAG